MKEIKGDLMYVRRTIGSGLCFIGIESKDETHLELHGDQRAILTFIEEEDLTPGDSVTVTINDDGIMTHIRTS